MITRGQISAYVKQGLPYHLIISFYRNFFYIETKTGGIMSTRYFNIFLHLSAFFLPVYFVYYPGLNDYGSDPLVKSLWKTTAAGFCFYCLLAVAIFVL